ncbi:MAG: cobyrinate a,c-diamide synthase [Devosia sp.]|nr:cobyrinate a,c-diamide synthase [Devosia sp.]
MSKGLVIGAPRSGSGKTVVTLGLVAALKARGLAVAPAKTGPDYIDAAILSRTAGREAVNLDPWAMRFERLRALALEAAGGADLLLVEGVMGLFDGAADGRGSTGDLAAALGLPVVLVVDAERQSQSIAALVHGFATWRPEVRVAGVIVNRAATMRHEQMLAAALASTGIPVLGVLPKRETMVIPERHLGLVLPDEIDAFDAVVAASADAMAAYVDLDGLLTLAAPLTADPAAPAGRKLAPLGQHIAIARDDAFAFLYPHLLADWRSMGADLSFFSPLADEPPAAAADAIFLPGGYPELHGGRLAGALRFKAGLVAAARREALIYGECGGYMVLGETLTDKDGVTHAMAGLLPVDTSIGNPRRTLGYRQLAHASPLPWPAALRGHEFHYSSGEARGVPRLFAAADAVGTILPPLGAQLGRVMGSYAHVIDVA